MKSTLADRVVTIPDLFSEASEFRFRSRVALGHSLVKYVVRLRAVWFRRETEERTKYTRGAEDTRSTREERGCLYFSRSVVSRRYYSHAVSSSLTLKIHQSSNVTYLLERTAMETRTVEGKKPKDKKERNS